MDEKHTDKLIKITIDVLNQTTFNPIVMKGMDIIRCIIKKGGLVSTSLLIPKQ